MKNSDNPRHQQLISKPRYPDRFNNLVYINLPQNVLFMKPYDAFKYSELFDYK